MKNKKLEYTHVIGDGNISDIPMSRRYKKSAWSEKNLLLSFYSSCRPSGDPKIELTRKEPDRRKPGTDIYMNGQCAG